MVSPYNRSFSPFSRDQFYDNNYLLKLRQDVIRLDQQSNVPTNVKRNIVNEKSKSPGKHPAVKARAGNKENGKHADPIRTIQDKGKNSNAKHQMSKHTFTDSKLLPSIPPQSQSAADKKPPISRQLSNILMKPSMRRRAAHFPKIGMSELPSLTVANKLVQSQVSVASSSKISSKTENQTPFVQSHMVTQSRLNHHDYSYTGQSHIMPSISNYQNLQQHGASYLSGQRLLVSPSPSNYSFRSLNDDMNGLAITGERIRPSPSPTPSHHACGNYINSNYGFSPAPPYTYSRRGSASSMISYMNNDVPLSQYMMAATPTPLPNTPAIPYTCKTPAILDQRPILVTRTSARKSRNDTKNVQGLEYVPFTGSVRLHDISNNPEAHSNINASNRNASPSSIQGEPYPKPPLSRQASSVCDMGTQTLRAAKPLTIEVPKKPKARLSIKKGADKKKKEKRLVRQKSKSSYMKLKSTKGDSSLEKKSMITNSSNHSGESTEIVPFAPSQSLPGPPKRKKAVLVMKTFTHIPPQQGKGSNSLLNEGRTLSRESTIHIDLAIHDNDDEDDLSTTNGSFFSTLLHNQIQNQINNQPASVKKNLEDSEISLHRTDLIVEKDEAERRPSIGIIPEIRMICATPDQEMPVNC